MRAATCTIKIKCTLLDSTPEEWGKLRKKIVHHLMDLPACRVSFFGWEAPSPELEPEDLVLEPGEHD